MMKKFLSPAMAKTVLSVCLLLAVCLLFPGPSGSENRISRSGFLLNTFVTITLYDSSDSALLDRAMEICREYEALLSKTVETSEIYQMNHRSREEQTFTVSDDTAALLKKSLEYCEWSGGAFDITIEPLSSLWNFTSPEHVIPDEEKIREAAGKVNYKNIRLDGNTVTFLSPETAIDLGATAKGYIADRVKEYLVDSGVKSATIDLGGNVLCIGERPNGKPFRIGLQMPFADRSETFDTLNINDLSVTASGVYERHFIVDGKNYHHILNPSTGYPYDNGLISVTILSESSVDGDGLSTACFSLGLEEGMKLADSLENVYAIFIDEDYNIYYSEGARDFLSGAP